MLLVDGWLFSYPVGLALDLTLPMRYGLQSRREAPGLGI